MRTYPPCWVLKSWIQKHRGAIFFFCKRGLPSPNISANHMARILSTSYVHVHVHTRTVNVCAMLMISYVILKYAPYDWLKCNPRLQKKNRGPSPFSFTMSVLGYFTCITQHTRPTALRPIRRTKQLWLLCLAQEHKHRDRPGRESIEPTFWQHQNLSPTPQTARPRHSILCWRSDVTLWGSRASSQPRSKLKIGKNMAGGSGVIQEPRSVTSDLQADPLVAWRSDARYRPRRYLDGISTRTHSAAFIRARASSTTVDIWHNEIPWMVRPDRGSLTYRVIIIIMRIDEPMRDLHLPLSEGALQLGTCIHLLNWIGLQFQVPVTLVSLGVTTACVSTMVACMMETMTVAIIVMKEATVSY